MAKDNKTDLANLSTTYDKLQAAIRRESGRDDFVANARIASLTLQSIQHALAKHAGVAVKEKKSEKTPWRSADSSSQAHKWAEILTKLCDALGKWEDTKVPIQQLFDELEVTDEIRRSEKFLVKSLSELNPDSAEDLRFSFAIKNDGLISAYQDFLRHAVGTIWPKWTVVPGEPLEAAPLIQALEDGSTKKGIHLGIGIVTNANRQVGGVGFLSLPGVRFSLSAVILVKRDEKELPRELGWNDIFSLGNKIRIHLLEGDCGHDHVLGQKRVEPIRCEVIPYTESGLAANPIATHMLKTALEEPKRLHAFISDYGTCSGVRKMLEAKSSSGRDVLDPEQLKKPNFASGYPPAFDIGLAFRYDEKIARLLKSSFVSIYEHCYSEMAAIYIRMANSNATGLHFEDNALREPHYKRFLQVLDGNPQDVPGENGIFGYPPSITAALRDLARKDTIKEPYNIETRWAAINEGLKKKERKPKVASTGSKRV